jgi:hypothetical protein
LAVAATSIQRATLVIADIGGYTRFMKLTRWNLAHAQRVVAELLEAVIDAAGPLRLSKLEGDAALFWAPLTTSRTELDVSVAVNDIRGAFAETQARLIAESMCDCESCEGIKNLKIKFVAHEGEVALQKVKRNVELAGVDVILVHRMLKNDVPVSEYVLMTDTLKAALPPALAQLTKVLQHDFEGIGEVQTHYVDFADVGVPTPAAPRLGSLAKLWAKVKLELKSLPYVLGLRKPLGQMPRTLESVSPQMQQLPK